MLGVARQAEEAQDDVRWPTPPYRHSNPGGPALIGRERIVIAKKTVGTVPEWHFFCVQSTV